jgi:hypothetical protein
MTDILENGENGLELQIADYDNDDYDDNDNDYDNDYDYNVENDENNLGNLETETENTSAIVVLTRGYTDMTEYRHLVVRNISIEKNLINKNIDVVIFHEGNIPFVHQKYIAQFTPQLIIKFVDITEKAFRFYRNGAGEIKSKGNTPFDKNTFPVYNPTAKWDVGYRNMCHFWFVDFWEYTQDYDKILRIDEDCVIQFNIDKVFDKLTSAVSVYGHWTKEQEYVSFRLNDFTRHFIKTQILDKEEDEDIDENAIPRKSPSGPYTNVIGYNLSAMKQNENLTKYIHAIKKSGCIYIYRWGDLPLMGEVLEYFYPKMHYKDAEIKYYHGSHSKYV